MLFGLIASSHWIIPPDVRPITADYLQDVGRSHQLGPAVVRFGVEGWAFAVAMAGWLWVGIKTITRR